MKYVHHFYMDYLGQGHYVGILQYVRENITFYFVDNENYFNGVEPYGDWYWDLGKSYFFYRATLSALPVIGSRPGVVHYHDQQAGLIPILPRDKLHEGELFCNMKSVITIHNLEFQGVWDVKTIKRFTELSDYYLTPDKLEAYEDGNLLKDGIVFADAIATIGSTYTEKIKLPLYGEKLGGLMRSRAGGPRRVINGIDCDEFNPETDTYIAQDYSAKNFRREKIKNKKMLQQELGLPMDEKKPMVDIVSRLADQRGFGLIRCVMDELCGGDLQLAVLGTGKERYESVSRRCNWEYHDRVSAQIYYSETVSHKIYTASDTFLMPSLFEPCGLSQLMALRYGTVPIVKETGSLKDTVEPYSEYEGKGTRFSFASYNAHEMLGSVRYAEYVYSNRRREWNRITDRTMTKDYS